MTVAELKAKLANMSDEQEVNVNLPLYVFANIEEYNDKRLFMTCNFPEEGLPISELVDDDELEAIFQDSSTGDPDQDIIDALTANDVLYSLESEYVHYEIR